MANEDFNPDRLIEHPRTLGEVYEKERKGALITECCGMAIGPECRFCPKCGHEARVEFAAAAAPVPAGHPWGEGVNTQILIDWLNRLHGKLSIANEESELWSQEISGIENWIARLRAASAPQGDEDKIDAEVGRIQDGIRDWLIERYNIPDLCIDGAGCDSGDPLDVITAEISQAIGYLEDTASTPEPAAARCTECDWHGCAGKEGACGCKCHAEPVAAPVPAENVCSICGEPMRNPTIENAIFGTHKKCLNQERDDVRLARVTWDAICNETAKGGDRPSVDIIAEAFPLVRAFDRAASAPQEAAEIRRKAFDEAIAIVQRQRERSSAPMGFGKPFGIGRAKRDIIAALIAARDTPTEKE